MKKPKRLLAQFGKYIPSKTELGVMDLRGQKDNQTFTWLMSSPRGKETIRLIRKILGLPEGGITPITDHIFYRVEDLPNFPSNEEVSWEKLSEYTRQLLDLLNLSNRFYESVKSFLVFGRAVPASPSVQPLIAGISNQELLMRIYPEAKFRDIRAAWHQTLVMQKRLPKETKKSLMKWELKAMGKDVYLKIFRNTVLEDLNSKKFRDALTMKFKALGILQKPYRKWNLELDSRLRELDKIPNLSDKERAEKLFSLGYLQDNIQKVRRIRHRDKHK
jgi:hypothetical protein